MKVLFMVLVLLGSMTAKSNPGNDDNLLHMQQSFSEQFANAREVKWSHTKEVIKADFEMNGQHATAFYTHEGGFIGVTRNLLSTNLPMELQADFRKHYAGFWISELFELSNDQGVVYFLTVENAEKKLILQSPAGFGWSVYQKHCK